MTPALLLLLAATTPTPNLAPFLPGLESFYRDLHASPELSGHEKKTAEKVAGRLEKLGFTVTRNVGGHGVVAVLKNGAGPTVMLRADLDGLPVKEETGLPFASKVTAKDENGQTVGVMHACGHDLHLTILLGTASWLAKARHSWTGTVVLVAQPDEERGRGAQAMLKDKLLTRFPKPDAALAVHDNATIPAGTVALVPGYALANVDTVRITLFGRGGHGSTPETTVDPIVLASKVVLSLQTLVSREVDPREPAVVTVGSFHAGTRPNIIPDEAKLELTVRSYSPEVRAQLREGIARIAKAEAEGARSPRPPVVEVEEGPGAVFNDPKVVERIAVWVKGALGGENVVTVRPVMGAEDFGDYGKAGGFPSVLLWVGGVPRAAWLDHQKNGTPLPSLHSPKWAPDAEPAIQAGTTALIMSALALLGH